MSGDRNKVLAAARSAIGYDETPVNKNKFSTYWKKPPEAWCADAATWALDQGHALDVPQSSYTPTLYQHYVDAKRASHSPKVGSLGFFRWPGSDRIEHVGIVEALRADGRLVTLEGNTSPTDGDKESQRAGGSYARKVRSRSLIVGYGHPIYGKPAPVVHKDRVLMLGAQGQDVLNVQNALVKAGFKTMLDGKYGPGTKASVVAFQKAHKIAPSGNVGADTWIALRKVAHS